MSYVFCFPVATAKLLKSSGFHAVTLANNHSLDYGGAGQRYTLHHLNQRSIVGSGHLRGQFELFTFETIRIALVRHVTLLATQKCKDFVPAQLTWGALSETDY